MNCYELTPGGCSRCACAAAVPAWGCNDRAACRTGAWPLLRVHAGARAQAVRLADAGEATRRTGLPSSRLVIFALLSTSYNEADWAEITLRKVVAAVSHGTGTTPRLVGRCQPPQWRTEVSVALAAGCCMEFVHCRVALLAQVAS
jgi:hypothetical protein